jgi:hypothetical protein
MFYQKLHERMMTNFTCLSLRHNPVLHTCTSAAARRKALEQYSLFPKEIIRLLILARNAARTHGCTRMADELTRNIGEELGTETDGVTHYQLLGRALHHEIALDVDRVQPEIATTAFLTSVQKNLAHMLMPGVFGAVYAMELSAVPELRVVLRLLTQLKAQTLPGKLGTDAQTFFHLHLVVWEPGHAHGLREVESEVLKKPADREVFEQSFFAVIAAMEMWWHNLAHLANQNT